MSIKVVDGKTIVTNPQKNLLGYEANSKEILLYSWFKGGFEEYLLFYRTKVWQRFLAKYLTRKINLGTFKKVDHRDYSFWYLFWCHWCERFAVNYPQGFEERLECRFCASHQHLQPGSSTYRQWSRRTALPKDYRVLKF